MGNVEHHWTNRLARKTYKALHFVEEELVGRGLRAVFVKSPIDTVNGDPWRLRLNNVAPIDEFVTSMYADNIRIVHSLGCFSWTVNT